MTKTITVSYTEYHLLKQIKQRYELVRDFFELESFQKPATKSSKTIISAFRKTNLYNDKFLKSLEKGLQESSYFSKAN